MDGAVQWMGEMRQVDVKRSFPPSCQKHARKIEECKFSIQMGDGAKIATISKQSIYTVDHTWLPFTKWVQLINFVED